MPEHKTNQGKMNHGVSRRVLLTIPMIPHIGLLLIRLGRQLY